MQSRGAARCAVLGVLCVVGGGLRAQSEEFARGLARAQAAVEAEQNEKAAQIAREMLQQVGPDAAHDTVRSELRAVLDATDRNAERYTEQFERNAERCVALAQAYLEAGWLRTAQEFCDRAEELQPGVTAEVVTEIDTAWLQLVDAGTLPAVLVGWEGSEFIPIENPWEVSVSVESGTTLRATAAADRTRVCLADYRPRAGMRLSAEVTVAAEGGSAGFIFGLNSIGDLFAARLSGTETGVRLDVGRFRSENWSTLHEAEVAMPGELRAAGVPLVVDTTGDVLRVTVGAGDPIEVDVPGVMRVGGIGLYDGRRSVDVSGAEFRNVRVAARARSAVEGLRGESLDDWVQLADCAEASGDKEAAAAVLRAALLAVGRDGGRAPSRGELRKLKKRIEELDPLSDSRDDAVRAIAKDLEKLAAIYTRATWHETSLRVLERAGRFEPAAVLRAYQRAAKAAAGATSEASDLHRWFGRRKLTRSGQPDGWVLEGETIHSAPIGDSRSSQAAQSDEPLAPAHRILCTYHLGQGPSQGSIFVGKQRTQGMYRRITLAEVFHYAGKSFLRINSDDGSGNLKWETVQSSTVWFTPSERRSGIEVEIEVLEDRVRARMTQCEWIELGLPRGATTGNFGFHVQGDSHEKGSVSFSGLRIEAL